MDSGSLFFGIMILIVQQVSCLQSHDRHTTSGARNSPVPLWFSASVWLNTAKYALLDKLKAIKFNSTMDQEVQNS